MAFYLPVLTALLIGTSLLAGTLSVVVALVAVALILYIALRHGRIVSRLVWSKEADVLLLSVLGLGRCSSPALPPERTSPRRWGHSWSASRSQGPAAKHAQRVLTPLRDLFAAVFFLFFGTLHRHAATSCRCCFPALALAIADDGHQAPDGLPRRRAGRASAKPAAGVPVSR